jgi:hypothetical protein
LHISSDTLIEIILTPLKAIISFILYDDAGPIQDAEVLFDGNLLSTDFSGLTQYLLYSARQDYLYSVEKEGYEIINDTIWLETDTMVNVTLIHTDINNGKSDHDLFHLFPNPASDNVNVISNDDHSRIAIINADGKTLLEKEVWFGNNRIDLTSLTAGVYIVRFHSNEIILHYKLLINK